MDISIFDIVENGVSNTEISNCILEKLKNKYNEEFCVKMIGNRYGTSTDDTVTTYCFPKKCENLLFTASLNKDGTIFEDDYCLKKITFELQENIKKEFEKYNFNVIIKAEIIGLNKLDEFFSVKEFIQKYSNSSFLVQIVCSEKILDHELERIYSQIKSVYKNIYLKTLVYFINKDKFEEFSELSKKIPSVTESIIRSYDVKEEKIIKIFEEKVIIIK